MQFIAKFIFFKIMGWRFNGYFPDIDKCVIIVVPHTSNWDFALGLLIRKIWNKEINYIGKKSLFIWPYGWFFRWVGGTPIDRTKNSNTVQASAAIFKERKIFRLSLSPEGTRKRVTSWKTGFYFIAKTAQVPVLLISFDYGRKEIKVSQPLLTTENKDEDFKVYEDFFEGSRGKNHLEGFFKQSDHTH
jgi:1-acyl-sn-glycerol-3-phosphate acyltransferase